MDHETSAKLIILTINIKNQDDKYAKHKFETNGVCNSRTEKENSDQKVHTLVYA